MAAMRHYCSYLQSISWPMSPVMSSISKRCLHGVATVRLEHCTTNEPLHSVVEKHPLDVMPGAFNETARHNR